MSPADLLQWYDLHVLQIILYAIALGAALAGYAFWLFLYIAVERVKR